MKTNCIRVHSGVLPSIFKFGKNHTQYTRFHFMQYLGSTNVDRSLENILMMFLKQIGS